jgi:hypothetical protein
MWDPPRVKAGTRLYINISLPKRGHRCKDHPNRNHRVPWLPRLLSLPLPITFWPRQSFSLFTSACLLYSLVAAPRMATHHIPQSLPSFAQAFSPSSLSNIHSSNSLPPIQARASFERFHRNDTPSSRQPSIDHSISHSNGHKRSRDEDSNSASG